MLHPRNLILGVALSLAAAGATPATGVKIPRSRLTFSVSSGTLATPTSVTLIIKRKSDNQYWNNTTGAWQTTLIENAARGAPPPGRSPSSARIGATLPARRWWSKCARRSQPSPMSAP